MATIGYFTYRLRRGLPLTLAAAALFLAGCDAIFGTKSDDTTVEIFDAGRTEPGLFNEVEYVALAPFFSTGGDGAAMDEPARPVEHV